MNRKRALLAVGLALAIAVAVALWLRRGERSSAAHGDRRTNHAVAAGGAATTATENSAPRPGPTETAQTTVAGDRAERMSFEGLDLPPPTPPAQPPPRVDRPSTEVRPEVRRERIRELIPVLRTRIGVLTREAEERERTGATDEARIRRVTIQRFEQKIRTLEAELAGADGGVP